MSNSKWRKPAGGQPAIDPSIPNKEPVPAARSRLSDQQVFDILDDAALFIHGFVQLAKSTLAKVGIEQLERVAMETEPEPTEASPQKRPRGRMHSLLLLVKFGIAATALVQRIFRVTHPHLFPAGAEPREKVATSAERFMNMVKRAGVAPATS